MSLKFFCNKLSLISWFSLLKFNYGFINSVSDGFCIGFSSVVKNCFFLNILFKTSSFDNSDELFYTLVSIFWFSIIFEFLLWLFSISSRFWLLFDWLLLLYLSFWIDSFSTFLSFFLDLITFDLSSSGLFTSKSCVS